MRTYADALALADADQNWDTFTQPGRGSDARVYFERDGDAVRAVYRNTAVVIFCPDYFEVYTGGYVTVSTSQAICTALGTALGAGMTSRVMYVLGHRMTEGMRLTYDFPRKRLPDPRFSPDAGDWLNHELAPLAESRGAELSVVDMADDGDGALRVTVLDHYDEGKNATTTARNLARAYVGRIGHPARALPSCGCTDRTTYRIEA